MNHCSDQWNEPARISLIRFSAGACPRATRGIEMPCFIYCVLKPVVIVIGVRGHGPITGRNFAAGSSKSWSTTFEGTAVFLAGKGNGGLLAQAARNQTQGVEAR